MTGICFGVGYTRRVRFAQAGVFLTISHNFVTLTGKAASHVATVSLYTNIYIYFFSSLLDQGGLFLSGKLVWLNIRNKRRWLGSSTKCHQPVYFEDKSGVGSYYGQRQGDTSCLPIQSKTKTKTLRSTCSSKCFEYQDASIEITVIYFFHSCLELWTWLV